MFTSYIHLNLDLVELRIAYLENDRDSHRSTFYKLSGLFIFSSTMSYFDLMFVVAPAFIFLLAFVQGFSWYDSEKILKELILHREALRTQIHNERFNNAKDLTSYEGCGRAT